MTPTYLFLAGAPKCGTSTAAAWLDERPGVSTARQKEPCHFTDFAERDWTGPGVTAFQAPWVGDRAAWLDLFEPGAALRVDASTDYLWCPAAPDRIARFAEDHPVKVAIILRDPVARAVSEYQHTQRDGYSSETLAESLAREDERRAARMHPLFYHVLRSRYADAVARYRTLFGSDLLILDYHRLDAELPRLAAFLGLEPEGPQPVERRNQGYTYRHPALRRLLKGGGAARMARRVVPKGLRAPIRGALTRASVTLYEPQPHEIADLRARLADEIAACEADPDIPTEFWHQSRDEA